jgi:hypothetical protein
MTCCLGSLLVLFRHPSGVTVGSRRALQNQNLTHCCICFSGYVSDKTAIKRGQIYAKNSKVMLYRLGIYDLLGIVSASS